MRNSRRAVTLGLTLVAVGSLFAATAGAQTLSGTYAGQASAEALTINLFGTDITTSAATAELTSAPLAKASATQILTPAIAPEPSTAETTTVGESKSSPEADCTGGLPDLTQIPGIGRADITCGGATVSLIEGGGSARGLGAELVLEPSVSGALSAIQLQEPAQEITGSVREALNPLVEALTGTPIGDAVTTVDEVLNQVLTLDATARIVIAPALAEVTAANCEVTAMARAQAIRVELLPVGQDAATDGLLPADLDIGEPLLTITLADPQVSKTASCDGEVTAEVPSAPLLTATLGSTALLETLGLASQSIVVEPGQTLCLFEGTPLETCLAAAASGVDAQGNPFADGSSIELFRGVNGGVTLITGRASSGGEASGGAPVQVPAAAPGGELPRTGGVATLPLVGGALLALAAGARRLTVGRR